MEDDHLTVGPDETGPEPAQDERKPYEKGTVEVVPMREAMSLNTGPAGTDVTGYQS